MDTILGDRERMLHYFGKSGKKKKAAEYILANFVLEGIFYMVN